MNVSEYIFEFFHKKGIDTAFMVTGGQAMFLNDAVGKNPNYQIICTHHEQSAAMSADAYGRITNKPAIALVTAGPGSVNAMNGVVGGYTDSAPMIVISGQANLSFVKYQQKTGIRQYGVQGIYIQPLVQSVVKYFVTLDDVTKIQQYLEKAYQAATTGRPGPVWIDVPLDMQKAEILQNHQQPVESKDADHNPKVVRQSVENTYAKLQQAKRPVFLAGQGVCLSGAREVFLSLAESLNIPVITARLGIDLIESEHRLYIGRPGNYGERAANFAIQNADVIVVVGCRLASSLVGHAPEMFGKNAYKIVVDIDPKELDKPGVFIEQKVNCDALVFLKDMLAFSSEQKVPDYNAWVDTCNSWKERYPVCLPEYREETPINSYYLIEKLSELASSKDAILVDTGSCFHVACQGWKVKRGQRYLTTGGLSSMGYWVAGIGACLANDRKSTIVITGDGSLQMNIQEFATIAHNKLPIKVIIFNNNGYLLIRHTQQNFMEGRLVGEGPDTGVWCPDALNIAKAYGIKGVRISTPDELEAKLQEVLEYDGPVICDVMTPEWQLIVPRISSEKMPDGTLVAHDYEDMFPFLPRDEQQGNMVCKQSQGE